MRIQITVNAEVNDKVFEELAELHERREYTVGTQEQYDKAIKIVEGIVGCPFYTQEMIHGSKPYISFVTTDYDLECGFDTVILE